MLNAVMYMGKVAGHPAPKSRYVWTNQAVDLQAGRNGRVACDQARDQRDQEAVGF